MRWLYRRVSADIRRMEGELAGRTAQAGRNLLMWQQSAERARILAEHLKHLVDARDDASRAVRYRAAWLSARSRAASTKSLLGHLSDVASNEVLAERNRLRLAVQDVRRERDDAVERARLADERAERVSRAALLQEDRLAEMREELERMKRGAAA